MALRVAVLLLFSFLTANAQNFGIVAVDPVSLTNIALNSDASEVFVGARRMPDGSADIGSNLYRVNTTTGAATKLTNYTPAKDFQGVTRIAYPGTGTRVTYSFGNIQTPDEEEIHILDTSTGADQVVYTYQSECTIPANLQTWNPCIYALHMAKDGTILFTSFVSKRLTTVKPDGTSKDLGVDKVLLTSSGRRVISDNGIVVFYALSSPAAPRTYDVYVINLDGTGLKQITHLPSGESASDPVISADGSRIVFTHNFLESLRPGEIWTVRTDGSDLRRLSTETTGVSGATISADGSTVAYNSGRGAGTVNAYGYVVNSQNPNVKSVSTIGDNPTPVDVTAYTTSLVTDQILSDDGKKIALIVTPPPGFPTLVPGAIHMVDAAPSTPVKFADGTRVYAPRFIYPLGVRDGSSLGSPSPGSIMTLFGYNLTPNELTVATPTLPTKLDGLELLLNGSPLPMEAVTPWQINAQVPQTATPGDTGFIVRSGTSVTPEVRSSVVARGPYTIYTDLYRSQAAALFPGTGTLVDQAHPAAIGQILELYCYGLGVTNPMVAAAVGSPSSPPATAAVVPHIRVGGVDADVLFSGLAPGLAGVYQVNLRVPQVPKTTDSPTLGSSNNPFYEWQKVTWVAADGTETGISGFYVQQQ